MTSIYRDNTATQPMPYFAYLVRLWQETPDGPWRASAQSVRTGEIIRFGSQQALFAFLHNETHYQKERIDE